VRNRELSRWAPWALLLLLALPALPGAAAPSGPPSPLGVPHSHPVPPPGLARLLTGPATPRVHAAFQVDPYSYYSSEPAPMGIADFGVNPSTSTGYTYNTTEFVGTINISSLTVLNASNTGSIDQMGFQLNVVLVVNGAGGTYEYWIQDVAFLNTTSNLIEFIDNVWNMSAGGAYTTGTDITGNGSGYYGWYFDIASSFLSGNDITLSYPATFQLRVVSSVVSGYPEVAFEYNDSGAWETYDNIKVAFARGYTNQGFVVDGTSYNPYGLFNDAELILGGPGGGSQTTDTGSNLGLTLQYWNGHNLQPIINAYNFGSDTAEGIDHVADQRRVVASDGLLYGRVTKSTTGSLSTLYDHSYDALVNVSAPLAAGTVLVNGTAVASYTGGDANLTLAPGTYDIQLDTPTGSVYASQTVGVPAGAYVPVLFGVAGSYPVTFKQTGLPTGTPWSITIGANVSKSAGTVINLLERNGTYDYTVTPIAGWTATPWSGNFTVAGASVTVGIAWTRVVYPVTFTESGLPNGTLWQVVVGGAGVNGRTATLQIDEPNGTFAFQVNGIAGYVATPASGTVTVSGTGAAFSISWGVARYDLTLSEQGLPVGTPWTVRVAGNTIAAFTSSLRVLLPNGTYGYQLGLVAGYTAPGGNGSVEIAGSPVQVAFNFTPFRVPVTFTESGLPAGANWSVSVAGSSVWGVGSALVLAMINGSYIPTVTTSAPYTLAVSDLSFSVVGAAVGVQVPFAPLPGWLAATIAPAGATVTVNGTVVTLSNGAFNLTLPAGNYTLLVTLSGYQTLDRVVSIAPGAGLVLAVNLTAIPPVRTGNGTQPIHAGGTSGGFPNLELLVGLGIAGAAAIGVGVVVAGRRRRTPPEGSEPVAPE